MNHFYNICCAVLFAFVLSGCMHWHPVTENAKVGSQEFSISMKSDEASVGDQLRVYREECKQRRLMKGEVESVCHNVDLGTAEVLKTIDPETALIRLSGNLVYSSGMEFEKIRK